jgi:murein DD-endopeptidase MepM/ murein hydrolase activator NlpD
VPAGPGAPGTTTPDPGTGWVTAIRSYSSYQAYGYRVHPITGEYKLHAGADFGASCGTAIYSVAAGTVTYAGAAGGYGNLVIIDHGNGISSAYGHMERAGIYVANGQKVAAGQNIAAVGTAGGSTGCHLHLEIRRGTIATDPVAFLATKGVR